MITGSLLLAITATAFWSQTYSVPTESLPDLRTSHFVHSACMDHAYRVKISVTSEVSLLQRSQKISEEELIASQLNFVRNSVLALHPQLTHFSFTADRPEIQITRREETYTDQDFPLTWNEKMIAPQSERLKSMLQDGRIRSGQPQRKVSFQAALEAHVCSTSEITSELAVSISLPRNPEIAFWDLPTAQWENLKFKDKELTLNLCASSELADLPQPEFYWYFWNPAAQSSTGVPCTELLESRLTTAQLKLTPVSTPLEPQPEVLAQSANSGTLILGWVNTQFNARTEVSPLSKQVRSILEGETDAAIKAPAWKEPTSLMLLQLVSELQHQGRIEDYSVTKTENSLTLELSFAEDRSLRIFWGPTDALGLLPPEHFELLADSLREDDVVIYAGHASLGQSLLPTQAQQPGFSLKAPERKSQVVAFLSCYSVNYLALGELRKWTQAEDIFVITTASSMAQFARASLSLLSPLSQGNPIKLEALSPSESWSDDQFVISQLRRPLDRIGAAQ